MLRKNNFDIEVIGGLSKINCKFIYKKQKSRRWRIIKGRLKFSYAHWTSNKSRIVLKKYLMNKRLWYSQKKNCLLSSVFEKKQENVVFSFDKKITIQSKIIDFNKKI